MTMQKTIYIKIQDAIYLKIVVKQTKQNMNSTSKKLRHTFHKAYQNTSNSHPQEHHGGPDIPPLYEDETCAAYYIACSEQTHHDDKHAHFGI